MLSTEVGYSVLYHEYNCTGTCSNLEVLFHFAIYSTDHYTSTTVVVLQYLYNPTHDIIFRQYLTLFTAYFSRPCKAQYIVLRCFAIFVIHHYTRWSNYAEKVELDQFQSIHFHHGWQESCT